MGNRCCWSCWSEYWNIRLRYAFPLQTTSLHGLLHSKGFCCFPSALSVLHHFCQSDPFLLEMCMECLSGNDLVCRVTGAMAMRSMLVAFDYDSPKYVKYLHPAIGSMISLVQDMSGSPFTVSEVLKNISLVISCLGENIQPFANDIIQSVGRLWQGSQKKPLVLSAIIQILADLVCSHPFGSGSSTISRTRPVPSFFFVSDRHHFHVFQGCLSSRRSSRNGKHNVRNSESSSQPKGFKFPSNHGFRYKHPLSKLALVSRLTFWLLGLILWDKIIQQCHSLSPGLAQFFLNLEVILRENQGNNHLYKLSNRILECTSCTLPNRLHAWGFSTGDWFHGRSWWPPDFWRAKPQTLSFTRPAETRAQPFFMIFESNWILFS